MTRSPAAYAAGGIGTPETALESRGKGENDIFARGKRRWINGRPALKACGADKLDFIIKFGMFIQVLQPINIPKRRNTSLPLQGKYPSTCLPSAEGGHVTRQITGIQPSSRIGMPVQPAL